MMTPSGLRSRRATLMLMVMSAVWLMTLWVALPSPVRALGVDNPAQSHATRTVSAGSCRAVMAWPIALQDELPPEIVRPFDPPERPWLAGHRGVDLAASPGRRLLAPAEGVLAFAGLVGGKSVVSVRHGTFTSTFEPARTQLSVGSRLERGQPFATVQGHSDHCDGVCVHWGVKQGPNDYLDPAARTESRTVILKPVSQPVP